ncbi:hypothetical protein [Streptomyces cyaneofuscatus]|uniref:hypothetical protein n=1 Tax=Streptomyces cyaneofuscatus TaxID=66883 RepID=UPI003799567C
MSAPPGEAVGLAGVPGSGSTEAARPLSGADSSDEAPVRIGPHAVALELDAIAAVAIVGTLLTGGSGFLLGTALGVLVLGLIQTVVSFQGTLSSWWTRIVIGVLLLVFILLQRLTAGRRTF